MADYFTDVKSWEVEARPYCHTHSNSLSNKMDNSLLVVRGINHKYIVVGRYKMIEKQIAALTTILKDRDIHEYAGDAFLNIVKAVSLGDVGALLDSSVDIKNLLFHTPTILFWDKMQRYMFGTFRDYTEQVKMAGKFNEDNKDYEKFVKRQIYLINEINDDKKVDYFAQLTRCYLLTEMENALYYKLAKFLVMCTPEELDYIASFGYEETTNLTVIVSSLYQYGLFEQQEKQHGGVDYVLSGFAKALKYNSLNFNEGISGRNRIVSYSQITPLSISEPMTWEDIDNVFSGNKIIINGNEALK